MQTKSLNSVKIRFLDKETIVKNLKSLARKLKSENKNIEKIYLFGSLAGSDYSVRSDADIFIVLKEDKRRMIDRIPEFLEFFLDAHIPVDILPYTKEELKDMKKEGNLFIKRILKESVQLA